MADEALTSFVGEALRAGASREETQGALSRALGRRWDKTGLLPQELRELVDAERFRSIPVDPVTATDYHYEIESSNSYRLCAEYSRPSPDYDQGDFWMRAAGYQCFTFSLTAIAE